MSESGAMFVDMLGIGITAGIVIVAVLVLLVVIASRRA